MDQPLTERRTFSRFGPPATSHLQAVLRPGRLVGIVNLSAGGALVEARRPLRPGSRVHLHLSSEHRSAGRTARVLRCAVASLDAANGVRYRGALRFEDEWDTVWEELTQEGYRLPAARRHEPGDRGHRLPRS